MCQQFTTLQLAQSRIVNFVQQYFTNLQKRVKLNFCYKGLTAELNESKFPSLPERVSKFFDEGFRNACCTASKLISGSWYFRLGRQSFRSKRGGIVRILTSIDLLASHEADQLGELQLAHSISVQGLLHHWR